MTGCQLYRHYDRKGVLLYVGVSLSAVARLIEHRSKSGWFSAIARVEIKRFKNRVMALEAEDKAIVTEHPKFNIRRPMAPVLRLEQRSPWPKDRDAVTIEEFCKIFNISEADYYRMDAHSLGPRVMRLWGKTVRISHEAAEDWWRAR